MTKIKTLIVDDSALMQNLLVSILAEVPDIEVVGLAADPYIARDKIKTLNPDVLTLDIEMPRMDGLTFLSNLMRLRPMPVIMLSSLTQEGAETTLKALSYGAVDFLPKPDLNSSGHGLEDYARELISKIRVAAGSRVHRFSPAKSGNNPEKDPEKSTAQRAAELSGTDAAVKMVIAIGASTGGTEAIREVVKHLPADTPPIVISQHLPLSFSQSFTRHVDRASKMRVQLAENDMHLETGNVYIAPGGQHLLVRRAARHRYIIELDEGVPVNRHRPSVDVMFRSVAESLGPQSVGILLTGMGVDGAQGLKAMHDSGAITLAQDQNTSVVWGMPGEAHRLGAVDHLLPLSKIPNKLLTSITKLQS